MTVVPLLIIVSIVILIPYSFSTTICPAGDVTGCWCDRNTINCYNEYYGTAIPSFMGRYSIPTNFGSGGENKPTNVQAFILLNITTVNIRRTRMTKVQSFILLNFKTVNLDLRYNIIKQIHPKAFWTNATNSTTSQTKLKCLYLGNNDITYVKSGTFDPLINLERLNLNYNRLSNIDNTFIVNIHKLEHFHIEHNYLTQLPTKWLPSNIQSLSINGNTIEYLSIDTFEGAIKLYEITLSLNNTTMEYNTFSNLSKLTNIVVYPRGICTCKYLWYLNTKSNDTVCEINTTKHASVREYIKEECQPQAPVGESVQIYNTRNTVSNGIISILTSLGESVKIYNTRNTLSNGIISILNSLTSVVNKQLEKIDLLQNSIEELKKEQKREFLKTQTMISNIKQGTGKLSGFIPINPCATVDEFHLYEKKLADVNTFNKTVNALKSLSKQDVGSDVETMMEKIGKRHVWKQILPNIMFTSTRTCRSCQAIYQAIKKSNTAFDEAEYREAIGKFLRNT